MSFVISKKQYIQIILCYPSTSNSSNSESMAHIYPHAKNSLMYGECQDSFSSWTAYNQETVSFL